MVHIFTSQAEAYINCSNKLGVIQVQFKTLGSCKNFKKLVVGL